MTIVISQQNFNRKERMKNYIIITDEKGNKRTFYTFYELIKYIDSFKMSFLPDEFSYSIHEE